MIKNTVLLLFLLSLQFIDAQITLTNNIGTTLVKTDMTSCDRDESWSRVFKLSDFGIKPNEQFIIKSGQVGLSKSYTGANLSMNVSSIDETFPLFIYSTHPIKDLGSRGFGPAPLIIGAPEIVQFDFDVPIIVPAGTDRIMVSVGKSTDIYNPASHQVVVAGTAQDTGDSWYYGCEPYRGLATTKDLTIPVPNANFFINVTGEVFNAKSTGSITRLTHNVCDDVIDTDMFSCINSTLYWAKAFDLKDFGISNNEEFVINSGQVGISGTGSSCAQVSFNIYKIDSNFPSSFSETNLIGSSQAQELPASLYHTPQVIQVDFDTPITIPSGVERILVEVNRGLCTYGDGAAFIAGSAQDNDVSWQRGCTNVLGGPTFDRNEYVSTAAFGYPKANFYINVTGKVTNISNHFEMNYSNICSELLKQFSVDDKSKVASILWNFGDPASGTLNSSTDLSTFHDFSTDGTYTITATVTAIDGRVELLSQTMDVKEPPKANAIGNVYACEDPLTRGFSKSFDVSTVIQQVLGGQTDKDVTFIDGKGNKYDSLPNPFTNTIKNRETITVRVAHKDNHCCYSETTFDLIVNPLPDLSSVSNINVCDNATNGFALFNLQQLKTAITGTANNIKVDFYHENGQPIPEPLNSVTNLITYEEKITVKASNTDTDCNVESTFKLIVNPLPMASILQDLIGCDDNNDGISEYFDTSKVESNVLQNQTGMTVTYFDVSGNQLPSPLPNPFTNTRKNQETLTVRVTNKVTNCYTESPLVLKTSSQPQINNPLNRYACDDRNGFANFDLSNIETEIIGNQLGLKIMYFDSNGNQLPSPLPSSFINTQPWSQTIQVRVENVINSLCFSKTSFDLIVNKLPIVNLEKTYLICNLQPSILVNVANDLDKYNWKFEDGTSVSNTFEANLVNAGNYTLTVSKLQNNIYCENSFEFKLIRSILPTITEVKYKELSENNFIEIIAIGEGDFEYSINGNDYQDSNYFPNIQGGTYSANVRDKQGCGGDSKEVTVIDYPKFFTPNNDGNNDFWNIKGVSKYPNSKISIFDRYGKLLIELSLADNGWNGIYNGKEMPSDDYWFSAKLTDSIIFSGHFALKR